MKFLLSLALLNLACLENALACQKEEASHYLRRFDRTLQRANKSESFTVGDYTWESAQAFIDSGARCHMSRPNPEEMEDDRPRNGIKWLSKNIDIMQGKMD